ncbi:MAG: hypothetical protein IKR48_05650 [Kiritimatiellae bacterium]|nr:hypothetical protein [Kiritimatiellia bacterium]
MNRVLVRWMGVFLSAAAVAFGSYCIGVRQGCETAMIDSFGEGFISGERHQRVLDIPWKLILYDRWSKLVEATEKERWRAAGLPKDFFDRLKMSISFGMKAEKITAEEILDEGAFSDEMRAVFQKVLSEAEESASENFPLMVIIFPYPAV